MNKVKVTSTELLEMKEELLSFTEKTMESFTVLLRSFERIEDYLVCRESREIKAKAEELKEKAIQSFEILRRHINSLSDIAGEYEDAEDTNIELIETATYGG